MGILFTILMGIPLTITMGILLTMVVGIQFTITMMQRGWQMSTLVLVSGHHQP